MTQLSRASRPRRTWACGIPWLDEAKYMSTGMVAAVSVGIVNGEAICDLEYVEDSAAETDMNVVMVEDGRMVEVQGTAEGEPFSHDELLRLLGLAKQGINQLVVAQREALNL